MFYLVVFLRTRAWEAASQIALRDYNYVQLGGHTHKKRILQMSANRKQQQLKKKNKKEPNEYFRTEECDILKISLGEFNNRVTEMTKERARALEDR